MMNTQRVQVRHRKTTTTTTHNHNDVNGDHQNQTTTSSNHHHHHHLLHDNNHCHNSDAEDDDVCEGGGRSTTMYHQGHNHQQHQQNPKKLQRRRSRRRKKSSNNSTKKNTFNSWSNKLSTLMRSLYNRHHGRPPTARVVCCPSIGNDNTATTNHIPMTVVSTETTTSSSHDVVVVNGTAITNGINNKPSTTRKCWKFWSQRRIITTTHNRRRGRIAFAFSNGISTMSQRRQRIFYCILAISIITIAIPIERILFGYKSIHGGILGRLVDSIIRTESFRQTLSNRNKILKELGIILPDIAEPNVNQRGIPVIPQSYLAETTLRAYQRQSVHRYMEEQVVRRVNHQMEELDHNNGGGGSNSNSDNHKCNNGYYHHHHHGLNNNNQKIHLDNIIPPFLLQPNSGNWYRPLPLSKIDAELSENMTTDSTTPTTRVLDGHGGNDDVPLSLAEFDESEMRNLMSRHCPQQRTIQNHEATSNQDFVVTIWGLCAVYWYGGYFVNYNVRTKEEMNTIVQDDGDYYFGGRDNNNNNNNNGDGETTPCNSNVALIQFQNDNLHYIKATPRHPLLACAIRKLLQPQSNVNMDRYMPGTINPSLFLSSESDDVNSAMGEHGGAWFSVNDESCNRGNDEMNSVGCCRTTKVNEYDFNHRTKLFLRLVNDEYRDRIHDTLLEPKDNVAAMTDYHHSSSKRVQVSVKLMNTGTTINEEKVPKRPIAHHMVESNCEAGWLCNRCYHTEWFGTYDACSNVCHSCHKDIICDQPYDPERKDVFIDVIVDERYPFSSFRRNHSINQNEMMFVEKRIPRIIHQTYFEELTPDRYPHLYRLQKSWKALPGWEYRFYTDKGARKYIHANFPSRFVEAFDALIPGAFKADFFRLLVLLKDGGVYSDVDVKLDIDLDSFITPNLGFFSPRDLVAGHSDGNYCFWNGFMGSAPGHPFLVSAVERVLNMVMNRGDYYDMEREACRYSSDSGATEIWKVRALDLLLLTGPCSLGVAVNQALGRNSSVAKFETGWLQTDEKIGDNGDVLILMADKYDLGELRFSDVDRNLLVASTEQTMITKSPFETYASNFDHLEHHHAKSHYSTKEHVNDIFGAVGIYTDNLVTNEKYKFRLVSRDRQ